MQSNEMQISAFSLVQIYHHPLNHHQSPLLNTASFPVILGDFGCDVICQDCHEDLPNIAEYRARFQASLLTRMARTGIGAKLSFDTSVNLFSL